MKYNSQRIDDLRNELEEAEKKHNELLIETLDYLYTKKELKNQDCLDILEEFAKLTTLHQRASCICRDIPFLGKDFYDDHEMKGGVDVLDWLDQTLYDMEENSNIENSYKYTRWMLVKRLVYFAWDW